MSTQILMLKILLLGDHENEYHKGWYRIKPFTSTVTLIKTDGKNILVDSGTLYYREKLIKELKKENLEPGDIDIIFNTHLHLDHTSNNSVFYNAKQFTQHGIFDLKTGEVGIYSDRKLYLKNIPENIDFFPTPGHFCHHMSLLYKDDKNYVIAGDVLREDLIRGTGFSADAQAKAMFGSMKMIFKKADVIIPGHGRIIEGKLFDELKEILLTDFAKKHGIKS